jgi:hypothetical protein
MWLAVWACVFSNALAQPVPARLAVAWTEPSTGDDVIAPMSTESPWGFETGSLSVDSGVILREAFGRLFVVSSVDGTVTVVDTETWLPLDVHTLGAGSEPLDIAVVSPELAYVTRQSATSLLRLELATGATVEVVDFREFADPDGVPDMGMIAEWNGHLLVQIRRLGNGIPAAFVPPAWIAVVDVATEQLVDTDPVAPGIQGVELTGTFPNGKMQVVAETDRLFVGATGIPYDDGGIEMVDLVEFRSLGLILPEPEVQLGAFVLVSPEAGYFVSSTEIITSSHLWRFTVADGVDLETGQLHQALGYLAPVLAHDPLSNTFFFPESGADGNGIHVFDAATGQRLTGIPTRTTTLPTDFAILPPASVDSNIPTVSEWGLIVLTLLTLTLGTIVLARQRHAA